MLNVQQQEIELKKKTLLAWAKMLLNRGQISSEKYNKMSAKIDRIQK